MAVNLLSYDCAEDDYIDMEVSSYSNFFSNSMATSPPHPTREFEFQMFSNSLEKDHTTSPADELFYKGKLLPLHLPPRLQMVEKLLESSNISSFDRKIDAFEEFYSTPSMTTPTTRSTPFESCNISPSESCRASRELNPEEYLLEYGSEVFCNFDDENNNPKKSWTKKMKLMKQSSSLGSKLKASRAYLKSWFGKTGCSDDSCTAAARVADEGTASRAKEALKKHVKEVKKVPFGQIQKMEATSIRTPKKVTDQDGHGRLHRRSFSMAIKRNSTNKPLSTSSSSLSSTSSTTTSSTNSSTSFQGLPFLKRSTSTNSEIENPIQGAIAHCKLSQKKLIYPRKSGTEVGFCSLSVSKVTSLEDQERTHLCRGW